MRGGGDTAREAGIAIVGGHSVDAPEPTYGLAVVGEVNPARLVRNDGARAGDRLVLTKPIGTGIVATALKRGDAPEAAVRAAVASMAALNRDASRLMIEAGAHAATDVTGFGLLGHLHQMLQASGAAARVSAAAVPLLPHTSRLAEAGAIAGGTHRNRRDFTPFVRWADGVAETSRLLLNDAQTSGGLLICLPAAAADALAQRLRAAGSPAAAIVGEVVEGEPGAVEVTP